MIRGVPAMMILVLAGCATQPAVHAGPGFFHGLLHGLIAPFALAASLVWPVRMYAFPNTGFGYDLGFLLGLGVLLALVATLLAPRIGGFLTREVMD